MHYYLSVFKKYAVFSGRSQRAEYWYFFLFNILACILLAVIDGVITYYTETPLTILTGIYSLAILIPGLAVLIRRLHDIGKSGWMMFVGMIPLVGPIWLFVLLVTDSNPGDNKYGPNPKGAKNAFAPQGGTHTALKVILIILGILAMLAAIGGGVYWYIGSKIDAAFSTQEESYSDLSPQEESSSAEASELYFSNCSDELPVDSQTMSDSFAAKFSELYPEVTLYSVGAYCLLSDDRQLVTFNHAATQESSPYAAQTVILFDENDNVLKTSKSISCASPTDTDYPLFDSVEKNAVRLICSDDEEIFSFTRAFLVDLDSFNVRMITGHSEEDVKLDAATESNP
jgi:uncharacterized membrane protein YhaH (DUF805 family)